MKTISGILLALIISYTAYTQQIGGSSTYQFLQLPNAARVAALGGTVITPKNNDLNLAFHNPSLLTRAMDNNLVLNYVGYFADVKFGYISYAKTTQRLGNFAAGLHYINYGTFTEADINGAIIGEFKAAEYALNLMWAKQLDSLFTIGATLKPILSNLETYTSFGIAVDLGATYHNPDSRFSAAIVIKNIGSQITTYTTDNYEPIPFDVQFSISKQLKHAPFRFTMLAHHLHRWDITYEDPNDPDNQIDPFTGKKQEKTEVQQFTNKLLRHGTVGIEILLSENFHIDFGYNDQRRQELKIDTRSYTVGFSWGFGLKISKLHISYGRATYHLSGASNHFSISTNFSEFYKKRENK